MFPDWLASHDSRRAFVVSSVGNITYGEAAGARGVGSGQAVILPEGIDSVGDLASALGAQRQVVMIDRRLPAGERERRIATAVAGRGREAATIVFTSGTTGPAKAVRLTRRNWEAAAEASARHLALGPGDTWLAVMPFHHVGGLSILFRTAYTGGTVHWIPRFDVAEVAAALGGGVTLASFVPTMLRRILDHDRRRYAGLRAVLVGGGPIPTGLLEEAHERGLPALPTYGMTETCAQVATLRPGSGPRRAAHPLPGIELRIDGDGRIGVRGRQVSPGYADEDDRPSDGWFTTPDLGQLEPDGALRVMGRADDVIVTGGENVNPARVEGELAAHPEVVAVAVIGLAHPEWGEVVAAAYEGAVDSDALVAWVGERLAPYEVPRLLRRLEEIPLTDHGKPDRPRLRQLLSPLVPLERSDNVE